MTQPDTRPASEHGDLAASILDRLRANGQIARSHGQPVRTENDIAAAQVFALLDLAAAIRSLDW